MNVAVLGASPKRDRYSNQAVRLLVEHGHDVVPVHPAHRSIEGLPAVARLDDLAPGSVDTVTMYVGSGRSASLGPALIRLAPRRVIFNPGAENPALEARLEEAGIEAVDACTLVLLRTGQFGE